MTAKDHARSRSPARSGTGPPTFLVIGAMKHRRRGSSGRRPLSRLAAFAIVASAAPLMLPVGGAHAANASYGLGTYSTQSAAGADCPKGFTCAGFRVSCPGVKKSDSGFIAKRSPSGSPRGLVMFFSGKGGNAFETRRSPAALSFMTKDLTRLGFQSIQVRWKSAWLTSENGEKAGPARLACRSATVIKWVHDHVYKPRTNAVGQCGFCVMGVSAGASQISYGLAFYGLDKYIDVAIPASGPPHGALAKGCSPAHRGYTWPTHTADTMDHSYGYLEGDGPCATQDQDWADRWEADGVDTGGSDYVHPETRVTFLLGTKDGTNAPRHGQDYADRLGSAGSPMVSVNTVDGMHHTPWDTSVGVAAVKAAILGDPIPGTVDEPIVVPTPVETRSPRRRPGTATPEPTKPPVAVRGGQEREQEQISWELVALGGVSVGAIAYAFRRRRRAGPGSEPRDATSPPS